MSSLIDLTIAVGLFFVFIVVILVSVLDYYTNFISVLDESELRTNSINVKNIFLGGKGVPEDWETRNTSPVRIGLINDLYKKPLVITTTNSTPYNNATINFTVNFDADCSNRTLQSTIKILNETNSEHPFTLYNTSFCPGNQFIQTADIAMNITIPALTAKTFVVFYSAEPNINQTDYGNIEFNPYWNGTSNYTVIQYPTDELTQISPSKVSALRNLTFSQIQDSVGGSNFKIEIDDI